MAIEIVARQPNGTLIGSLCLPQYISLTANLKLNDPGRLTLVVPRTGFYKSLASLDVRLEIWRESANGSISLFGDTAFFVDKFTFKSDTLTLEAESALGLIARHLNAFQDNGDTAIADNVKVFNTALDDMIKRAIRYNIQVANSGTVSFGMPGYNGVSATPGSYRLSPDPVREMFNFLQVQADSGQWSVGTRRISNTDLLTIAKDNSNKHTENIPTSYGWFNVVQIGTTVGSPQFEFQTYLDVQGSDRRGTLVFEEFNSLVDSQYTVDYQNLINRVYVSGSGTGAARLYSTRTATNVTPATLVTNPVLLREAYRSAGKHSDQASLDDQAEVTLQEARVASHFEANLSQGACSQFGVSYDWGDRATAFFDGNAYDVFIDAVILTEENATESLEIKISSDGKISPTSPIQTLAVRTAALSKNFNSSLL